MKKNYVNQLVFIIVGLSLLFALYLQYEIVKSTDKLKHDEIVKSEKYAKKIVDYLQLKTDNKIISTLKNDPNLRSELNDVLQTFLTEKFQYIFVLNKDSKGHYRFLLDGSKEEPVEFQTIFFPQSKTFDNVFLTHQMHIAQQEDGTQKIWLSLLYPINENGETQALLVMDISEEYADYLNNINSPLQSVAMMMQIFLFISMVVLIWMAYRYHRFRQTVLIDKLTGAHTKLFLEEFFNRKKLGSCNAILIDIDEFKEVNAKFGYGVGDKVLKEFVETIQTFLSLDDILVRIGGGEFFIAIPKTEQELDFFVQDLFINLKIKRYLIDNELVSLNVSMSAMVIPDEVLSLQNVLRVLDEKLLEVKNKGKNDYIVLKSETFASLQYGNMDYIKEALEDQRLVCLYQPIYDIENGKIAKYEALVRLRDKIDSEKLITPNYFLPAIRGTTQYIKMSKLVLEEVFSKLHVYTDIKISMNLDLNDLYSSDMMKLINKNLYKNREVANRITFEILEYDEIIDYEKASIIFQQLRAYGSQIAIDDFGSGYSNFTYLIRLNIDIVKIDGSLIRELAISSDRTKIVIQGINDMAVQLGMKVIAEFIYDETVYHTVESLKIRYAQGNYLGEPKPIEAYEKFNKV
ncbi:MAG: bifunctional diguanylate cyclase/phosphodiesterase [Campylobacterales bacterium]|nr:bifunctional diguanylate cyclase/phosphodiesterase [Campylobacterales bacterium]